MALSNNTILKEFFADLAGTDATGKSFNSCLRLGLEAEGYSGSINSMLRAWANATAGTSNLSVTSALKLAFATAVGSTQSSLAGLTGDFVGESPNWSDQLQSFAQEGRTYLEFDNP
tara:strand:+ start:1409 stop:1756 length:348 start_codon:yes stop_codon:yes gene_type:complete